MEKNQKSQFRKWFGYVTNVLFLLVILTLIIPSWRNGFQAWFTSLTLENITFAENNKIQMPQEQRDWELFDTNGLIHNFAELEGKPIVLSFWATWCSACRAEFPDLNNLRSNWDDEVAFLAVTTESVETIEASGYAEQYDFLYATQAYPPFFDVKVFPTLAILDKDMNLVFRMEGAADINNDENVDFLNRLLSE